MANLYCIPTSSSPSARQTRSVVRRDCLVKNFRPAVTHYGVLRPRVSRAPLSVGAFAPSFNESSSMINIVSQVASAIAWAAAAYLGYQLVLQQDSVDGGPRTECETCNGTGQVPCICTRWSDAAGDKTGCGACGGTRQMACTKCGGGGTAVPIEARVYIKQEKDYY
jgi:hypothetical protein